MARSRFSFLIRSPTLVKNGPAEVHVGSACGMTRVTTVDLVVGRSCFDRGPVLRTSGKKQLSRQILLYARTAHPSAR